MARAWLLPNALFTQAFLMHCTKALAAGIYTAWSTYTYKHPMTTCRCLHDISRNVVTRESCVCTLHMQAHTHNTHTYTCARARTHARMRACTHTHTHTHTNTHTHTHTHTHTNTRTHTHAPATASRYPLCRSSSTPPAGQECEEHGCEVWSVRSVCSV